jgi:glutaminase
MGIGVFSPLLDVRGNSVRGVKVCEELSQQLGLHLFQCSGQG